MSAPRIDVLRGGTVESTHRLHGAVVAPDGTLRAWFGDPDTVTFFRSSAKPFQALPLVEDGVVAAYDLSPEELAVCCASHSGEPRHIELVERLLARVGVGPEALACGPQAPFNKDAAEALVRVGTPAGRIHNNCSGKHAGMLLLALHHGWDLAGYEVAAHPVQQRMLDEVSRWSGVNRSEIKTGVDGCGVVCFALSLRAMAAAYAQFLSAAKAGRPAQQVVSAMTRHPFAVAGTHRLCTDLMQATHGDVWAKVGAEGVYGAGIPSTGLGLAMKAEDGGWRAGEVGLIAFLDSLGALSHEARAGLADRYIPVRNTLNDIVGKLEAHLTLVGPINERPND